MPTLCERLQEIKHRKHDLSDGCAEHPHRPDLSLWADYQDDSDRPLPNGCITISLAALHGQQIRFVTLTPLEARALARDLIIIAGMVDACVRSDQASITIEPATAETAPVDEDQAVLDRG